MKRTSSTMLIAAFVALFAVKACQLSAQAPQAEYLTMGPYTNDFSAPMPNWWFYDMPSLFYDATTTDPTPRNLYPIVYSNDFAFATEGIVQKFAAHAEFYLGVFFWRYGGAGPYAPQPYWNYYGSLEDTFFSLPDPATPAFVTSYSASFWLRVASLGGDGTPPWQGNPPASTNAVNIGQVKNAFSFILDDADYDAILDAYEYSEFGALDVVEDLLDDPGGDGLCLLAEIQSGLDPLAGPEPFATSTNGTAVATLFPSFDALSYSIGEIIFEREFAINRRNSWQHYFITRNDDYAPHRVRILYSDIEGQFHEVGGLSSLTVGDAIRLDHVSTNQTSLVIRVETAEDPYHGSPNYFSCPSLSLVSWVPKIEFSGLREIHAGGRTVYTAIPEDGRAFSATFTVDWSGPPDGSDPAEWPDAPSREFPLCGVYGLVVDPDYDSETGLVASGTVSPSFAGVYPLDSVSAHPSLAQPVRSSPNSGDILLFLTPRLDWPGGRGRCGTWLDYDPVQGIYTNASAYPLDSGSLLDGWHFNDDRACGHAPEPTLDLGDPSLDGIVDHDFEQISDAPLTSRCTITLGGSNIWEEVVSHHCPESFGQECHSESPLSDPDCGCDGADVDGDSFGSCSFRLALGFPMLDTVSGFLWFRSEEIPAATPAMLSLMVREGASVTCESNNPGGAINHIRCLDERGRDITVAPIANGLRLTVSNSACTYLDHSWEITNPGNNLSRLRIRKISRLDNPLSDHTYELSHAVLPDAAFHDYSEVWRRTDNLTGLVETRIVSDGLNDPSCRARMVEVVQSDDASGAIFSYSQSRSALFGEGVHAVLRETNRVERTWDAAHPRQTFATYWTSPTNKFLHGKARLTYGDRTWTYRAYDALGRETLRLSQLDGSPCPVDELEALLPETFAAAISTIPASTAFSATVTDYEPLDGDSEDDLDASLPRTVSEYEVRAGTALPAARAWTVYDHDGFDEEWELPLLTVRTERAATPTAAFGDNGNAVSSEVSYDIRDAFTRRYFPLFDGLAFESTDEDGRTTSRHTEDAGYSFRLCGAIVRTPFAILQLETDHPLPGHAPDPMRPKSVRVIDDIRATEIYSGQTICGMNNQFDFDFRYNLYDDQDRLRATFFPDGSSTTNAYSCCRLLWSRDRDGRKTVRSALTGEDRLYYANLETSLGEIPSHDRFGPYADRDWWTEQDERSFRIAQHFMDAVGRETNTVSGVLKREDRHKPATRTFSNNNPNAWRSNATVSYPDGVSGHSVSTDARGLVTESFSRDFPDRMESVTVTYPRGEPSSPFYTNTVVSYRNGAHVSERRWGDCWTRTTESSFRDALGRRTSLSVTEASDLPHPVTNRLSVSDFLGRTILAETPLSSVTYVYDGATSRVVSETDSKSGVTTLHHYDAYGEPTGTTRLGVTSLSETSYVVEDGALWRVSTSVVSNGVKTASSTETRERLTGLSNALRSETTFIDFGVTNAVSRSVYDQETGILATTTISPTLGTNVVDRLLGATIATHGPSGTVRHYYDPYGRRYFTERSVPGDSTRYRVSRTEFNSTGDITCEDRFHRVGVNFYSTYHGYDCRGNRIATTNALGGVERRAYDALGRPVAVWGSAARPTLYSYDTQGRRTTLSTSRSPSADAAIGQALAANPNSPFSILHSQFDTTQWRYDPATGLCLNKIYPVGPVVTNTYTPDGLLASRRNANQSRELFTYDANRRLVSCRYDDLCEFGYDAFGNRIHSEYGNYPNDFLRDDRGAVTNEYDEVSDTSVATSYDAYGRMASRTVRGRAVHYSYAPDGQLATVSNDAFRVDYLYTPDRLDAGYVVTTAGGVEIARHVTRDYWRRQLVTVITNSVTPIFHSPFSILHSYSYDALGRPVSRNDDDFGYNARSEISETTIGGVDAEYSYDSAGNRTSAVWDNAATIYTANSLNQYGTMTSGGMTDSLSYDIWGNLTATRPFAYSYYDGLLNHVYTNRANGPYGICYYEYDAEKRLRCKDSTPRNAPRVSRYFTYAGWSLQIEDVYGNGSHSTTYYVWGKDVSGTVDGAGGVGGLLATEVGGVWYFPLYDNNGNVTDYVSETGDVVASYAYDAFGRTIAQSGPMADTFPFRFSTKYYDAESGLYYYGKRYYSPELGRWMTRDPIEEDGGDNLYAFCGNNGICRHDYLGHVSRGSVDALKKRKGVCYIFTIKVDTVGYDYSSGEAFIKSMAKRASKNAEGVGHSWVRLEDVRYNIVSEGGHSGENGDPGKNGKISNRNFLTYAKGVAYLAFMPPTAPSPLKDIPEADPANPARWLWYIYEDGEWKSGSGGHTKVDSELSVSISKEQYDAIKAKIDAFGSDESLLRNYGLTGNQCTSTAASLADMAGIHLDPYVQLNIPSSATLDGHELRLWSDPKYSSIRFAIPEKMEQELKMWRGSGDYVYR